MESRAVNPLPQRSSLVSQTVALLRESIRAGAWNRWLPGEMELCERFQISRGTLRAALEQLEREGWIRGGQGRRRQIRKRARGARLALKAASTSVVLLSPMALPFLPSFVVLWIDDLRRHLADGGYHLEIQAHRACYGPRPGRELEKLAGRHRAASWVLLLSTAPMQEWFSRRALPCVIAGTKHANVKFSSVDLDHRAICRHAVGRLCSKGHHRLVYLSPNSGVAGDWESDEGFEQALAAVNDPRTSGKVVHHNESREGICARLDWLLSQSEPPTGFLVARAPHVLSALGHLLRRGIGLPQEAALISRDDDPFFENVVPTVARYRTDPTLYAHKISRLAKQLADGGTVQPHNHRIMPRFISGETLG